MKVTTVNAGSSHRLPVCGGGTSQGDLPPSGPVWQYPGVCRSLHQVSSERKKASHFCPHTSQRGHCLPPEVSERLSPVIRYSDTDRQRETSCQSTTRAVTTSTWNIVNRNGHDSDIGVIPGRFEDGSLRSAANKLTEAHQSDVNYKQIAWESQEEKTQSRQSVSARAAGRRAGGTTRVRELRAGQQQPR